MANIYYSYFDNKINLKSNPYNTNDTAYIKIKAMQMHDLLLLLFYDFILNRFN